MIRNINEGDVFYVRLSRGVGSEQYGIRPAVIVQRNNNPESPTTVVVPLTSAYKTGGSKYHITVRANPKNGLSKDSLALCEQVRVVDKARLTGKVGRLSYKELLDLKSVLRSLI